MTDRVLTPDDLLARGQRPGLYQLRVLERTLRGRIAELDARVDELLSLDGPPTDDEVAQVDVLCAAIAEARELMDEARREAVAEVHRRIRRDAPRRWA
jgi:hypothetical protein